MSPDYATHPVEMTPPRSLKRKHLSSFGSDPFMNGRGLGVFEKRRKDAIGASWRSSDSTYPFAVRGVLNMPSPSRFPRIVQGPQRSYASPARPSQQVFAIAQPHHAALEISSREFRPRQVPWNIMDNTVYASTIDRVDVKEKAIPSWRQQYYNQRPFLSRAKARRESDSFNGQFKTDEPADRCHWETTCLQRGPSLLRHRQSGAAVEGILQDIGTTPSTHRVSNGSIKVSDDGPQPKSWSELLEATRDPARLQQEKSLALETEYLEKKLNALQLHRKKKTDEKLTVSESSKGESINEQFADAFTPLSTEADKAVDKALLGTDRREVLVMHENSNIDVTRGVIQCLLKGAWLNDEVINLYMELLKERERRDPRKFLKCHFFNTFFYNKLYKDKRSYDYKSVRRWTTPKKLGYSLSQCDKILVPIHQDIHWCLAVINIRDKKFEYLDSLKGVDNSVLEVLAKYIVDETKDKDGEVLDTEAWECLYPDDIPQQLNGCDCGVFMVKYADFHSRGAPLFFKQEHMEYFRRRMVWEILSLRAC